MRIVANGLGKRYGRVVAVNDLSFTVEPGVVTGFLGPNGAGKSTTMRLMLGLDHGSGKTQFDGLRYAELAHPVHSVGVMLDARAVHPGRKAHAHLRMLAAGAGLPAKRADEVLEMVGLASVANKRVGGFSLGMAQRLGLAAALLGNPAAVLLDEPANGLDPEGVRWLRDLLKALASEGRAVLVSSHLLNEVAVLADALVVLGKGQLIAQAPLKEFIARNSHPEIVARSSTPTELAGVLRGDGHQVRLDPDGTVVVAGTDLDAVATAAMRAGIVLRELTARQTSLEDAFFSATENSADYRARPAANATPTQDISASQH